MLLGDFHIHSTFSDGRLSIPEIVDLYGSSGFDVIAITDHLCDQQSFFGFSARILNRTLTPANYPTYIETIKSEAERAWNKYQMLVIPGVEYTRNSIFNSRSAHVLGLGIENYIDPIQDPINLAKQIKEKSGLSIAAHPVWTRKVEPQTYHLWDRREELKHHFDAWEVASGPDWFDEVANSGLPILANSDLHHPAQIQSWKTLLDCKKNIDDVFAAIRLQKIKFMFFHGVKHKTDIEDFKKKPSSRKSPVDLDSVACYV